MSRTFRRRHARHDYVWELRDYDPALRTWYRIDAHSLEGRKAIARFHSDAAFKMSSAPNWYCKLFNRKLNTANDRQLRRWRDDPGYDPVFEERHMHSANWSWW